MRPDREIGVAGQVVDLGHELVGADLLAIVLPGGASSSAVSTSVFIRPQAFAERWRASRWIAGSRASSGPAARAASTRCAADSS
jgi:hypothetical protein